MARAKGAVRAILTDARYTGRPAKIFAPHRINRTVADIAGGQHIEITTRATGATRVCAKIAHCGTKLGHHRAAEAGADPATVTRWIAETNAELAATSTAGSASG